MIDQLDFPYNKELSSLKSKNVEEIDPGIKCFNKF